MGKRTVDLGLQFCYFTSPTCYGKQQGQIQWQLERTWKIFPSPSFTDVEIKIPAVNDSFKDKIIVIAFGDFQKHSACV